MRRSGAVLALVVLAGCASSLGPQRRYLADPTQAPPRLGFGEESPDLSAMVEHWIVPNGPGTWVRDARWDEVVLSFTNPTTERVTIDAVRLIDPRGLYIEPGGDPTNLETRSEELASEYADIGVSVAIFAAPSIVAGAAIAGGAVGTAVAAAALAPAAIVAAPAYYFWRRHAKAEDRDQIEAAFNRRRLSYPAIAPGGTVSGSYFFPIVPNPQTLVIDYRVGTERKTLEVSLEELRGLHVAASAGGAR